MGFLLSFLGGIIGLFILGFIDSRMFSVALILPGVIPHFFCGASAGVFANAEGGLKGCIIGSFLHGMLITFLPAICMPVMGSLNFANSTFSDADFSIVGIILGNVAQRIQGNGLMIFCIILFLSPIVLSRLLSKKEQ
jgi:ascorbate PTS system EIIC component